MSASQVRLDGRVVLVTGGGRGMGEAYCLEFARRGAAVVVNDLGGALAGEGSDPSVAEQVVAQIQAAGGRAVADDNSVSDPDGARRMVQRAVDAFGHLDSVVANAGVMRRHPFPETTIEDRDAILAVNYAGVWNVVQAAWPQMVEHGFGRVVCVGSHAGFYGSPDISAYAASKGALLGLARTLAAEGADHDITVNVVAPGATSRMSGALSAGWDSYVAKHRTPDLSVPSVLYLLTAGDVTGRMFATIGHRMAEILVAETTGFSVEPEDWTAEAIRDNWDRVVDRKDLHISSISAEAAALSATLSSTDLTAYGLQPDGTDH